MIDIKFSILFHSAIFIDIDNDLLLSRVGIGSGGKKREDSFSLVETQSRIAGFGGKIGFGGIGKGRIGKKGGRGRLGVTRETSVVENRLVFEDIG